MRDVFAFKVDGSELSETVKFSTRTVKFGDGYEQRQAAALRPALREWQCRMTGSKVEVVAVAAFFDRHGGVKPFVWRQNGALVKVAEYTRRHLGGRVWQISWKFEEVLA